MKTGKRMAPEDNNKCNRNAVGLDCINLQKTKATQKQTKPNLVILNSLPPEA